MALRPKPMQWFEIYVPRHETVRALGVLAQTGKVELDVSPKVNASLEIEETRKALQDFAEFENRYRQYWPTAQHCPIELPLSPQDTAKQIRERLYWWSQEAEPIIQRIQKLGEEIHNLEHLKKLFVNLGDGSLDISPLSVPMKLLYVGLGECPINADVTTLPDGVIVKNVVAADRQFVIAAGLPEHAGAIETAMASHGCQPLSVPPWLSGDRKQNLREIAAHIETADLEQRNTIKSLGQLSKQHGLEETLGDIGVLKWYVEHAPPVEAGTKFCHVTGWTTEPDAAKLNAALRQADIHAMIRFPHLLFPAPAPTALKNPEWVKPFELFTQMLGTPGKAEVDPSALLFVVVPLLFGYMFPDVGHGLLLIVAGLLFARRWPPIALLIPCGVAAIGFGFAFGEFFSFETIIPSLWLKPLDNPMTVMIVPMIGGVVLMLLGIMLAAVEAHWRGELRAWLAIDAAVVLMYASALTVPFYQAAWSGIAIGGVWYFLGGLGVRHVHPIQRLLELSGQLLESVFQLLINTLSFARVGAFALAHVALSSALMTLASQIENPVGYVILIVLGNLFIVTLGGVMVFVQTTRLILFEFFIRFLRAEGRIFKPLRRPTSA